MNVRQSTVGGVQAWQNEYMPYNLRRLSMLIDEHEAEIIDQWKAAASKLPAPDI